MEFQIDMNSRKKPTTRKFILRSICIMEEPESIRKDSIQRHKFKTLKFKWMENKNFALNSWKRSIYTLAQLIAFKYDICIDYYFIEIEQNKLYYVILRPNSLSLERKNLNPNYAIPLYLYYDSSRHSYYFRIRKDIRVYLDQSKKYDLYPKQLLYTIHPGEDFRGMSNAVDITEMIKSLEKVYPRNCVYEKRDIIN